MFSRVANTNLQNYRFYNCVNLCVLTYIVSTQFYTIDDD